MRHKTKVIRKRPISSGHPTQSNRSNPSTSSVSSSRPTRTVSSKVTQSTIASFHILLKRQSNLQKRLQTASNEDDATATRESLKMVEREMERLGGLSAYQEASKLGQSKERGGDSSHVLVKWCKELGRHRGQRLRMLEIGALTPANFASCSKWIDNEPIDLHAQHPDIKEQDFFQRPLPATDADGFDVISCSLVLNFVSSPGDRGEMLRLMHKQLKSTDSSLLFLVLPLPCVINSRYLSPESLVALMKVVGFGLVRERWRPGGKVGYWLWRWVEPSSPEAVDGQRWSRKVIEQDGPGRNNFSIVLA